MSEEKRGGRLETWLGIGLVVSILLSTSIILLASSDKETVYSAYVTEAEGDYNLQQLSMMRDSLDKYTVANTMSTPMLVNDWREPHRTTLVIVAPEKPFDMAEAEAIHDFVTNKGGKVILAADSSNAQRVADQFGVQFFENTIMDMDQFYEVKYFKGPNSGTQAPQNQTNVWTVASLNKNVSEMNGLAMQTGCSDDALNQHKTDNCRMPVLMRSPTAIQVLGPGVSESEDVRRDVKVLATASDSAYQDVTGTADLTSNLNIKLGAGETGLIIRIDYPGIKAMDINPGSGDRLDEIEVTGSIVFVANDDAFADHLWDLPTAVSTGKAQCQSDLVYANHTCWNAELSTESNWKGNGAYFAELIHDMSEQENDDLSSLIKLHPEKFYLVFDESRHVTSTLTSPFTEAMGAIVLLTSDAWLKWLIVLNLLALLSIAIMVVPEKENWRHVFDLTRFRERPEKIDPSGYQQRVRQALMEKVRIFHDLTKEQMIHKTPPEIQAMIRDPRLIELAYSQNRVFSPEELRQLLQAIRRWGK